MAVDIDYNSFGSVSEVQTELDKYQTKLHQLVKHADSLREDKAAMSKGFNEQIKEAKEKMSETAAVIDGLIAVRSKLGVA